MSQLKHTFVFLGKRKKTSLLAMLFLVLLIVFLSFPKSDKSEVFAQRPGSTAQKPGSAAQKPGTSGSIATKPSIVRVETVGTLDRTQPVPKMGTVSAKETVQIVPRVSGYLRNVAFKEGDYVQEGDLLFEIEDTVYDINVRAADSVTRQIEAEIVLSEQNYERVNNKLLPNKAATEQDVEEALRSVALHKARLEEAKAKLDQAKNDLSYTKIYAPLSGRIGAKQFSVGNYLTPTSGVLATIMQFDPITVTFPVSEREFLNFFHDSNAKKDVKYEILMADGSLLQEEEFEMDFLDNNVDRFSGQIMVYLLCQNKTSQLFPGGFVTVKMFVEYEEPQPAVSVAAIMTDGASHYVYVMQPYQKETQDEKGNNVSQPAFKAVKRNVTRGPQVFDRQIIESGLVPGEQVVVAGLNKILKDGQDITTPEILAASAQVPAKQ